MQILKSLQQLDKCYHILAKNVSIVKLVLHILVCLFIHSVCLSSHNSMHSLSIISGEYLILDQLPRPALSLTNWPCRSLLFCDHKSMYYNFFIRVAQKSNTLRVLTFIFFYLWQPKANQKKKSKSKIKSKQFSWKLKVYRETHKTTTMARMKQ